MGSRRVGHHLGDCITDAMDVNLGKLWEMVRDREAWHAIIHGVTKSWTPLGGLHHRCNGRELGQTLGDGEGQGSLACYNPWGHEELDTTWPLNNFDVER